MTDLWSNEFRLISIFHDDLPSGINQTDLWEATSLGQSTGAKLPPEMEKELSPIDSIERVCEALIKHANRLAKLKGNKIGAPTRVKNAVPASTINFLAWEMLVRCNHDGIAPPVALLNLVNLQLGIRSQQVAKEEDVLAMKLVEASMFAYRNPGASFNEIAKRFDVNVSTISRWDEKYDLKKEGESNHHMCAQIDQQTKALRETRSERARKGKK